MAAPSEFKCSFDGKGSARKFFYLYENVVIKVRSDEEKDERIVAYLTGDAFEYYFDNFTEENPSTEDARSVKFVKDYLFEKFLVKKTDAKTMKEAVNFTYVGKHLKEFFVKARKLNKEAGFNE